MSAPGGRGILEGQPGFAFAFAERQGVAIKQQRTYQFDTFHVDPATFVLTRNGRQIHLEPRVLKLLVYLIEHRDHVVARDELIDTVWGETVISDAALSKAVGRLRKALGDDAGAPRYIETTHSLGYRFIAAVDEIDAGAHPRAHGARRSRRALPVLLALCAIAALAVVSWQLFRPVAPPSGTAPPDAVGSLAVLPLGNLTGEPALDAFVAGVHDVLTTEISQRSVLRVTSRQSTKRYAGSARPLAEIAAELGVDVLVEGSVLEAGDRVRITAQLIDGRSDGHLWANAFEADERNLLGLIATMAEQIVGQTQADGAVRPDAAPRTAPLDPAASRAFLAGLEELNRLDADGFRRAIRRFQRVVGLAPDFAPAWGELAAVYLFQAVYGVVPPVDAIAQARRAARTALDLDEGTYIAHAAMGYVALWSGDTPGAMRAFRRALQLNPSDSAALHGESDCLLLAGRLEESLERIRKGQLIDPFTPVSNMPVPIHLFLMRRYDEAIAEAIAVNQRIPAYSVHWLLARIYWQQGRYDEALDEERLEFAVRNDPVLRAALERGRAAGGATGAMRAIAVALAERAAETYVDPFRVAVAYARAGAADEALEWLSRAVDNRSPKMTYIGLWPEFDLLRDDPRFAGIERSAGGSGN
ncbi:MAG: winged helix-turn-helix domain-containing protein [Xanthomonadales bacterium]